MATIEVAQKNEISKIMDAMRSVGLSPSLEKLSNYFFGVPESESSAPIRGGLTVKENGRVVGFCGLSPCRIFIDGHPYDGYQMGVLGMRPGLGTVIFDLIEYVQKSLQGTFVVANTANEKSVKLWTQYGNFLPGPSEGAFIHYDLLPLSLLTPFRRMQNSCKDFTDPRFTVFWQRCLSKLEGVMTSRDPSRLQRLFGSALKTGQLSLIIVCDAGEIAGYAILRAKKLSRMPYRRFEILDMLACGNSAEILGRLFQSCRSFARHHSGLVLEYVGASRGMVELFSKYLPRKRPALANTAFWYTDVPELHRAFMTNKGWCFGPYDGDRCAL